MTITMLLWASVFWLPILLYVTLNNETKFKKNITIGVTLPQEARQDADVLNILAKFKRHTFFICLGLIVIILPCLFVQKIGMAFTLWMLWIDLSILLPYLPYVRCNQQLKQLKQARGWQQSGAATIVDLSAAALPGKWLSHWFFLLPLVISLLPLFFDRDFLLLCSINAITILFCWFGYRYLYRNKAELVDDNLAVTEALTRIRRYNWGKLWLYCTWALAALNLFTCLLQNHFGIMTAAFLLTAFAIAFAAIRIEFKTRRWQETLTAQSGADFYVDDDDKWLWGLFYYNPHDAHLIVNHRIGINSTINLAKPSGQLLMGILLLLLLSLPFIGVWMDHLEQTPVSLSIQQTAVVAAHTKTEYQIPLDTIVKVEFLEERPSISRVNGTGMDNIQKGKFKTPYGTANVCLNPHVAPYLLITQDDGKLFLLGSSDRQQTIAVYQLLLQTLPLQTLP